jgi:hypothetical protein
MSSIPSFECPFCLCNFVSKKDLDVHLEAFGSKGKEAHLMRLREVHHVVPDSPYLGHDFLRRTKNHDLLCLCDSAPCDRRSVLDGDPECFGRDLFGPWGSRPDPKFPPCPRNRALR